MHLLIAEGDTLAAKFLSGGFEAEHYEVRVASEGGEVAPMIKNGQCDLLILDLTMPGISGLEVLRKVRAVKPHLPVLFVTASIRVEDRVGGLDSGADDCLAKP